MDSLTASVLSEAITQFFQIYSDLDNLVNEYKKGNILRKSA